MTPPNVVTFYFKINELKEFIIQAEAEGAKAILVSSEIRKGTGTGLTKEGIIIIKATKLLPDSTFRVKLGGDEDCIYGCPFPPGCGDDDPDGDPK